ncbi:PTS sugar transporter subunit IIB [Thermoanaerobacterium saccharolyticum]|jgi:PTS system, Lactose/Cellobiose specific IIB subunit.|uniref:PTS sugar transporter subunit IIB n=1 Tax=Thermoanaerobacterium saccharolyticum TaxID=28896 RepID=UPI002FDA1963
MLKIILFCSSGSSTSMLIGRIEEAAKARGIEVAVDAYPEAQMEKYVEEADVVLLGPQVKFILPKAKKICSEKGVPVDIINPVVYGMMDGEKVLDQALSLAKK